MKKQAIIEIQEPGGATTYIVGTAVNVTVTGGQKIDPFAAPGAAQDGEVYISVGGRRRPLGDVKVYRVGYTSGGVSAPAPAGVTTSTSPQASTLTVTGTPAVGATPTAWILGLTGTGAPKAVYVEGARTHAFVVTPGVAFTPYAIALYGNAASVKITGTAVSVSHPSGTAPVFNGTPAIVGTAQAYEILVVDPGAVSNGTVDVRETTWYLDGSPITGRVGGAVRLEPGDVNHRLRANVVARNAAGFTTQAVTAETPLVSGRPIALLSRPSITGGGRVGDTHTLDDGTANYWSTLYRVFEIDGTPVANGARGFNSNTLTWVPEAADVGKVAVLEVTRVGTESQTYVSDPVTILPSSAPAPGPAPAPAPTPAATKLDLSLAIDPSFDAASAVGMSARAWDPLTETFTYSTSAGTLPLQNLELGTFPQGSLKPNTTYTFSVTSDSGGQATLLMYGPERSSGVLINGRNGTFTTGSTVWSNYAQIKFEPAPGVANGKFRVALYEGAYTGATPVIAGAASAYTPIAIAPSTPIDGASVGLVSAVWDENTQTLTYTTNATPQPVFWVELASFPTGTFKANTQYSAVVTSSAATATARVVLYDAATLEYDSLAASNTTKATWWTGTTILSDYAGVRFNLPPNTTNGTIKVDLYEGVFPGGAPAPAPAPSPAPSPGATEVNLSLATLGSGTSVGFASKSWDPATQTFTFTSNDVGASHWLELINLPANTFKPNKTYSIVVSSSPASAGAKGYLYNSGWASQASAVATNGATITWASDATVINNYMQIEISVPAISSGSVRVAVYEGVYGGAAPAPAPAPTPAPAPAPSPTPAPAPSPAPAGLPTRANVPMLPTMTTGATPYQDKVVAPYAVLNDTWGVGNAQGPFSEAVGITPLQSDGSVSGRFTWNFAGCSPNYNDVLSYPALRWGAMVNKDPTPGSTLPKQLSQINTLTNRLTWDVTGASGLSHLSADFWLATAGGFGYPANRVAEIMMPVWVNDGYGLPYQGQNGSSGRTPGNYSTNPIGARNPSIYIERATIGGRVYDVYMGMAPKWRFIVLIPFSLPPMGQTLTFDWKPILNYFVAKGWATNAHYLWGVQWGIEPVAYNKNGVITPTRGDCLLNLKVTAT